MQAYLHEALHLSRLQRNVLDRAAHELNIYRPASQICSSRGCGGTDSTAHTQTCRPVQGRCRKAAVMTGGQRQGHLGICMVSSSRSSSTHSETCPAGTTTVPARGRWAC